ncbi:hypothetical protein [Clostridium beijerinckii]|uniref:hypothetical protein n=1 Tax=Clostridium beijerinckii TaxID=1520 RepID=UPI0022E88149|nr:hypothetical protein [Clostridium beijerinckii]
MSCIFFYGENQSSLYLIDYSWDDTKVKPDKVHDLLNKEFEFIGKMKYTNEPIFTKFKEYLKEIQYDA